MENTPTVESCLAGTKPGRPLVSRLVRAVGVVGWLLVAGCASHPEPDSRLPADAVFQQLADEYLAGYLAWRPMTGTALGLHEYDGRQTDFTRASLDAELARLRTFDQRMAGLNAAALSAPAFYDYRILRAAVRRELFRFEEMRPFTRNPMTYAGAFDVNLYVKRDFAPLDQRARSLVAILNQAPKVMAAARANLDAALPRSFVETAMKMAEGSAAFLEQDLVQALTDLKDGALRAEFAAANQQAIAELRGFVRYLEQEKLPRANDAFALGRHRFARLLRETELVPLSPERVLAIGLGELRREQALFAETARQIDPSRKPSEVFHEVQREHPSAEDLIPETKRHLEAIRQFVVDHRLVTIPSEVRPRVAETPQFERATSFASMDAPGIFETKANEAYYYVTPVERGWTPQQKEEWLTAFNYYTTDVVSIHEAYPGHYVQFLCLNASPATRLEKILGSYAFVEGWAHYAERMMLEQGFGTGNPATPGPTDPLRAAKYRLAQLDESLLRLCRLCVAVRMHCQGMSVEQATGFFRENCYYEEKPAHEEAVRGTFDPGYLNYALGKLMILKLRADCQRQESAAFSLQKFHDELLRHGAPPVPLLRELLLHDRRIFGKVL